MYPKYFIIIFVFLFPILAQSQSLYLKIEGHNSDETKVIDSLSYKNIFIDYSSLEKEVVNFKEKLNTIGFFESQLKTLNKQNDTLFIANFELKNRYKTIKVYHYGLIDNTTLELNINNVNDEYFQINIENLEKTLQTLNDQILELGDPFSSLQLKNINKIDTNTLSADLFISKQIKRTVDTIIVKGYEKFPKTYLKRFLKLKPKQIFSLNTIKSKTSALEDLRFAKQIKDPEVLFTKDSTILYIYVEKVKSNSFDGFLGFGTNAETSNLEFDGYLNLNLVNNLNFGESIKLFYKSDENDQKTFDANFTLPYLFGSPIGAELGLNIFKKDSSFLNVAQTAKLAYAINPKSQIAIGINSVKSTNLLDNDVISINDFTSIYYTADYSYKKIQRQNFLFPVHFLLDIKTGFGNRNSELLDESQTRLELNTYKIFNFNSKNSIYTRVNSGILISDNYLENELLRFGGINSIRGFEENSLSADLYGVFNTEYRYKLNNALYVHTVFDVAYFENKLSVAKEKLFAFGFGFGLLTKAGLFKFNYSGAKTENQKFKLSNSKIHISLSASF